LRLVGADQATEPEPYYRVHVEQGADDEEVVLVTISRHGRLLEQVRARLGAAMSIRKITPDELTFVISEAPSAAVPGLCLYWFCASSHQPRYNCPALSVRDRRYLPR